MNDEEIKKTLDAIQARFDSASLAELSKLSIEAGNLLNFTSSPEIEDRVRRMQAAIETKVQEVERAQSSQHISTDAKGPYDGDNDKDSDLDKLAKENDKIYEKFLLTHEKDLVEKKKDTQNLRELEEKVKAGKPIGEDLKKKILRTPEQSQAAKESNKRVMDAEKAAQEEVKRCKARVEELRKDLAKASSPDEREKIRDQIDHLQERQIKAQEVISEVNKHIGETHKQLEHLARAEKMAIGEEKKIAGVALQQRMGEIDEDMRAAHLKKVAAQVEQSQPKAPLEAEGKNTQKEMGKTQPERSSNSEEAAKLLGAFKKSQPNPPLQTSAPLTPPNTPSVNGPASGKSQGGGQGI